MNYPNYYGGYPYYQQPQMADQLTQLRGQQMGQPTSGIIWVQGEEGAKGFLTAAGNSVLLMDSEASTFYIKSTDQSGMPLPLRVFDYTERTGTAQKAATAQNAPGVEFVTRQEFDKVVERLDALTAKETKKDE